MNRPRWARGYWPRDHGPETRREAGIREQATLSAEETAHAVLRVAEDKVETALHKANNKIRYLFFVIAVYSTVVLGTMGQNIAATHHQCRLAKAAAIKSNLALDYFSNNNISQAVLTSVQQDQRARNLRDFRAFVPESCPGIWPFQ